MTWALGVTDRFISCVAFARLREPRDMKKKTAMITAKISSSPIEEPLDFVLLAAADAASSVRADDTEGESRAWVRPLRRTTCPQEASVGATRGAPTRPELPPALAASVPAGPG